MPGRGDSFSEPFGLSFKSTQDFAAEYRKRSCHKGQAEELYIHVLQGLNNSLKEDKVDSYKLLSDFVDYISTIEDVATLTKYYSNSNNPIKNTNFVILSCKYNSQKILEYLFGSVSKILQNVTVDVGNMPILPNDADEMQHNAFYYAIRSGNVQLLGILINKWPCSYFSTHENELHEILSNAYEELLVKNVPISESMTIYVENELINIRFHFTLPDQDLTVENTLDYIRERVGLLCDSVSELNMQYSGNKIVDGKFFYKIAFVAKTIHILKKQLKSTYDRLPWEEMEFCLITVAHFQVPYVFLNEEMPKSTILTYLQNFTDRLSFEISNLDGHLSLTALPIAKREKIVADIVTKYPDFGDLYKAHQKNRDMFSLMLISEKLQQALSADPKVKQGQCIIIWAMHNVAELLKNTLESPNLSSTFAEFLLRSMSSITRSVLIDFCNSKSRSDYFWKRTLLARKADVQFFTAVQKDFKRIDIVILNAIRLYKKFKAFKLLLLTILKTEVLDEVKKATDLLQECYVKEEILKEIEFMELLMGELVDCVAANMGAVRKEIFDEIQRKIDLAKIETNNIRLCLINGLIELILIRSAIRNKEHGKSVLSKVKELAVKLLADISTLEHFYKFINLEYCVYIFHMMESTKIDDHMNELIHRIVFCGAFVIDDLAYADEIRKRLFGKRLLLNTNTQSPCTHVFTGKYEKFLPAKLCELETILSENSYTDNFIDNIKMWKTKKEVMAVVEMLLLDILSIVNGLKQDFSHNQSFLDNSIPLLLGEDLCHYLAHKSFIFDILPHDPSISVILNAKKMLTELSVNSKMVWRKPVMVDVTSQKSKFQRNLLHLSHQKEMFAALEEGNLESLKATMNEGADITAKSTKMWSALHFAAKGANLAVVKFVIEQNINVNAADEVGKAPIHVAAANGRNNIVQYFLKEQGVFVNGIDNRKRTPLHFAAGNGNLDTTRLLLDSNGSAKCKSEVGFSPVHYAICNNFIDVTKVLLEKEANVDINETMSGQTCLHLAASNGCLEIVQFLLSNTADVDARDLKESTPVHLAAENGHLDVVKALILNNADVNHKDSTGKTPLHLAAIYGHEEIVKILLKHKANEYATDIEDRTALYHAVVNGHLNIATLLVSYGVNTGTTSSSAFTPLQSAVVEGHTKIVELLILNGADVSVKTSSNQTLLHLAAGNGTKDIIDILIKNKVEIDARDETGKTPLGVSVRHGNECAAVLLMKYNADVNAKDNNGLTILNYAVQNKSIELLVTLFQNGAKINAEDGGDNTLLHDAVSLGNSDIVEALITVSDLSDCVINNYHDLLQLAVVHNQKDIVETLLKTEFALKADKGEAFTWAVCKGYSDIVEIFLEKGVTLPGKTTPLHLAAKNGHVDLVHMFIRRGASVNEKDFNSLTPLYYAAEGGHSEVAEILISNGANFNSENAELAPFYIAALHNHGCVVEVLIRNGAGVDLKALEVAVTRNNFEVVHILVHTPGVDMEAKLIGGSTILHIASQANNLKMVEYLVDEGSNINARNELNFKPIHTAASKGYIDIVKCFLRKELGINETGGASQTLLHLATANGHPELVKFLIEEGADIDAKDDNENTPMHLATVTGAVFIVKILLRRGATFNAANKFHKTPIDIAENVKIQRVLSLTQSLFEAVKHKNGSEVKRDIAAGAFVNAKNVRGGAPLHFAAWKGYDKVASILLEYEANPNAVNDKGLTPMHYATKFSHMKVVKTLLAHGAIYNAVSYSGKTPLDLATDSAINDLLNLIAAAFQNVADNDVQVLSSLNKITDTSVVRAIMSAQNLEKKTLLVVAVLCKFSKVEELMSVSQDVSMINLASFHMKLQSFEVALSLYSEILVERQKILGPNNPGTLMVETNIADTVSSLEEQEEALIKYENIYEKQITMFGLNHKETLRTRYKMAEMLVILHKHEAALTIFQDYYHKVKDLSGFGFGPEDTFRVQLSISKVLTELQKLDEAIIIYSSLYVKTSETLGSSHLLAIDAQRGVADILHFQGRYDESLKVLEEVLEKEKKVLGTEHVNTIRTLLDIALVHSKQNKSQEALTGLQRNWVILKNAFGEHFLPAIHTQFFIGMELAVLGKFVNALEIFRDNLKLARERFGYNHEEPGDSMREIEVIKVRYRLHGNEPADILNQLDNDFKFASVNGTVKTVQRLLEGGIDLNKKDAGGITPLHYAVSNGHIDVVDVLLRNKANVTVVTPKGNTLIHTAVSKGYKAIAEVLLQNVKPNKLSELVDAKTIATGTTALHVAAKNSFAEIVKLLLENGATYNVKNKEGKTPVDLCEDKEIANFLIFIDELFTCAKNCNNELINKLQKAKPDDLKAIANTRSDKQGTLLQVTGDKTFAKQLSEILQMSM